MSSQPSEVPRYHIETWGCQMNVHDSEKLAGVLEREGYRRAADARDADVILLNTCSIREKAAEKVFDELGRLKPLKEANPNLILGLCGCVAQQEGEAVFRRAPYVDFVLGPRATGTLAGTLARLRRGDRGARHTVDTEYRNDSIDFPFDQIRRVGQGTGKAFVTVIEGCNHRCTYCIVPTTRGREICRDMDDVLAEVRALAARGVLEVEFLGQTVNAYRDGQGRVLADLLLAAARIEGLRRVRFTTSHPAQMTERLMDAMAEAAPVVAPYLHLPVQSGSSRVLRDMRRGYDRAGYLAKIDALRRRMPDLAFGTDVIVGFPTESDDEFAETMSLLDEVEFDTVYSFTYSPRPGTAAEGLADPLSPEIKLDRLIALQARQKTIQLRRQTVWIGREAEVLVEGPSRRDPGRWTGRTADHRIVHFGGQAAAGQLARVRITEATAFSLRAEPACGWGRGNRISWCPRARGTVNMTAEMSVEMTIKGLMIDPVTSMPIVILKNETGDSVLPIWVGIFEANAIAMQLEEIASPRPMTHDLLKSVIETLRAEVKRIVITDLKDNTFFALIHLDRDGETLAVDARPSDAMALALRAEAPIFVERQVLTKSEKTEDGKSAEAERLRRWLETVDPEELGKYEM